MVMELLSYDAPRSDHDPELAQAEASDVARHPVTGAFENESHESAFRAQIFRSAFTGHALLMTLSLAVYIWVALVAPPDLRVFWTTIALITTFFTVGRVLLHHMEDTQRGQRVSSWAWTGFLIPISIAVIYVYMVNTASTCSLVQLEYFAPLTSFATALINGSHGLGFVHKMSLVGLLLVTDLVLVTVCGELALALALCNIGALVVGSAAAHMVEVYLRHSYAEKVQDMRRVTEEKRRLEERNEQLQTSNERLLYDMQLRARSSSNPNLDEDDRSAIRRGLQAGASQPHQPAGDADSSEAGGPAPSGTPPPSLPPGAPSSTTSGPSDSPLPSLPRGAPSSTAGSSTAPPPLTETDGDPERRAESAARPAVVQHGAAAQRTWRRGDRARRAQRLAESANVVGLVAAPRPPCGSRAGASSGAAAGAGSKASFGQELAAEALADMANPNLEDMAAADEDTRMPRKRGLPASSPLPASGPLPEGVYASGGGFGAELQKGGKQLCQDGFLSPAEAAQERAMWKQGIEKGCRSASNSPAGSSHGALPSASLPGGPASSGRVSQERTQARGAHGVLRQRSSGEDSGESINSVSMLSILQEKFVTHVMCDYTPRPPSVLPMKQWVSYERLIRQL